MLYYVVFGGFLLSFILTLFVRQYAIKKDIIDQPNERSSHSVPTPRGGGLAIALTWYLTVILLYQTGYIGFRLAGALFSGIILSIVSFIDDVHGLSPKLRLIAQVVSTLAGMFFLKGLHQFDLGIHSLDTNFPGQIFIFFGIIWMINLFNFLDGTDGYLGSEGLFIFAAFFILTKDFSALIFAAIILGFLVLNWPKAKIFCGDIGSTLIGYTMAIFAINYQNSSKLSLMIPVILSALFWFDASITLFRRWRNSEKLSVAHKKHAYQRLNQSGFSHLQVLLTGWGINVLLFGIAWVCYTDAAYTIYLFMAQLIVMTLFMVFVERRKGFIKV